MKNSNNIQDRKFEKQLSHLSSFTGMPMWNGRNPTLSEIREFDRLLLEKQAQGFEPKRQSVLKRLGDLVTIFISKTSSRISKVGEKNKDIKLEIPNPLKTGDQCCG